MTIAIILKIGEQPYSAEWSRAVRIPRAQDVLGGAHLREQEPSMNNKMRTPVATPGLSCRPRSFLSLGFGRSVSRLTLIRQIGARPRVTLQRELNSLENLPMALVRETLPATTHVMHEPATS
jgi:hypothetical protein